MAVRPKLTLERSFRAAITDVWELWTTREGIESWWGPEGFTVRVRRLDLRPGGQLLYVMSATGPDQVDYMKKASMPITTEHSLTYTEVAPQRRLAYRHLADFIPGVEPYEVETVLELAEEGDMTNLTLTFDAMHDDRWTKLAVMGHESELARLEQLIARGS
ncbi:MAG TPA: SRPBCC domain-containing protein [Candidatus Dormibacteraeota bacterium]|nr:SRPBCC domain-containing protein [Candidatus Dormibacteraeota bacterium]